MKAFLTSAIVLFLVLASLTDCQKSTTDILSTPKGALREAATTPHMVTLIKFAFTPDTEVWGYNQSSSSMTMKIEYNNTTSGTSGWVNAGTYTLAPRKDMSYCRLGVKQFRVTFTYDSNAGFPQFLSSKKSACR